MTHWLKHSPLALAIAACSLAVAILAALGTARAQGAFTYPLDDTYIHMAMANNLAAHGVWGVTEEGFTSSSSSPLWTAAIAAVFAITGAQLLVPLALALASALALLVTIHLLLRRQGAGGLSTGAILLAVVFFTPLPPLVLSGLEHLLHATLTVAFLYKLTVFVCEGASERIETPLSLLGLAAALPIVRYEGLLLVGVACALLLVRGRPRSAWLVALAALAPIAIYGLISWSNGWYLLPNTVLIKGSRPELSLPGLLLFLLGHSQNTGTVGLRMILEYPHMIVLVAASLVAFILRTPHRSRPWEPGHVMLGLFVATALLHAQFAAVGWFYRYEAYLIAAGFFAFGLAFHDAHRGRPDRWAWRYLPPTLAAAILAWLCLLPFAERGLQALRDTPQAMRNIHDQQIQMGRFVARYYDSQGVAANDVGAVSWIAGGPLLDLVGLADMEIAVAKRQGRFDLPFLLELLRRRGIGLVLVSDEMLTYWGIELEGALGRVGEWTISENVIAYTDSVSFYAVDPAARLRLEANLEQFEAELPPGVTQRVWSLP